MNQEELKSARESFGLSQGEFAQELGKSIRTYGEWERGKYEVPDSVALLVRYILRYGLPRDALKS